MEQNLEILVRAVIASYVKRNRRTLTHSLLRSWLEHRIGETPFTYERFAEFMEITKSFEQDTTNWDDTVSPVVVVDLIVDLRKNLEQEFGKPVL